MPPSPLSVSYLEKRPPPPLPSCSLAPLQQERLGWEKFELMVWKLEVHNAAATDRALTFAGATYLERIRWGGG